MGLNNGLGALSIKKFNGTAWDNVGTNSPSNDHSALSASLKFDALHNPYIAYMDTEDNKGYVRRLNGSNAWVNVGQQVPAPGMLANIGLVVAGNIPFVAFGKKDNGNITQIAVKRYNAATDNWVSVGPEMATSSTTEIANLTMTAGQNKLYISFHTTQGHIYAKSFDASTILPVTLQSFTVAKEKSSSLLTWSTTHEENNLHFELQHSKDGNSFTTVATVASKGNTSTGHQYSFVHALPIKGMNYYRLKQVDKNGSFSFSKVVRIEFSHSAIAINVFPNPVNDILHVQHSMNNLREIIVRDAVGKTVKQIKTNALSFDVPVSDLAKGNYFVCLVGDGATETTPFVK